MIRLATLFSGIGAVEQALIRMNKEYKIVFACDNGDIDIDIDTEEIRNIVFNMKSKKQKKDYRYCRTYCHRNCWISVCAG